MAGQVVVGVSCVPVGSKFYHRTLFPVLLPFLLTSWAAGRVTRSLPSPGVPRGLRSPFIALDSPMSSPPLRTPWEALLRTRRPSYLAGRQKCPLASMRMVLPVAVRLLSMTMPFSRSEAIISVNRPDSDRGLPGYFAISF